MKNILSRIQCKKACVGVIGLGYVGLPLSLRFAQKGFNTVGFDLSETKTNMINDGKSYIKHIDSEQITKEINNNFIATVDFRQINKMDIIIICVPTPLDEKNNPDLSYIKKTLSLIRQYLKQNQLIVLESTTYPGTTEEEIVAFLEKNGFTIGKNYYVGYSPEREDPGNKNFSIKTIPKVVSGFTNECLTLIKELYIQIVDEIVPVSSTKVAEMTKILENIHRSVNIGLVNELKIIADKMGIDIFEVINAAATKPFGFTAYYPGPGLGGHCIPIDPFYLSWKAKQIGIETKFIELAGKVNRSMPDYVIKKLDEALKNNSKSIKNSRILVMGLAYKKNVDDLRESPALKLIDLLFNLGSIVEYSDPFIPELSKTMKYNFSLKSVSINSKMLKSFDAILLVTDHDAFDYSQISKNAKIIVNTRGRFKDGSNIVKA